MRHDEAPEGETLEDWLENRNIDTMDGPDWVQEFEDQAVDHWHNHDPNCDLPH